MQTSVRDNKITTLFSDRECKIQYFQPLIATGSYNAIGYFSCSTLDGFEKTDVPNGCPNSTEVFKEGANIADVQRSACRKSQQPKVFRRIYIIFLFLLVMDGICLQDRFSVTITPRLE